VAIACGARDCEHLAVPASFVCRKCGRVTDLPGVELDGDAATPRAIGRGEVELVVYGRCDRCA